LGRIWLEAIHFLSVPSFLPSRQVAPSTIPMVKSLIFSLIIYKGLALS